MLPILNVGPLAIQLPGLFILIGIWLGIIWAEKTSRKAHLNPKDISSIIFIAAVAGIVAARIFYVLQFPQAFSKNIFALISIKADMLDPLGGIFVGIIAGVVFGQRKKLPLWSTLDVLTSFIAVLLISLGFSQLASGSAFGTPSHLPWSIDLWGIRRHPTQAYSILISSLIAFITTPSRRFFNNLPTGSRFLIFISLTAIGRIFVETFRADSALIGGNFRVDQLVAWLILALSIGLFNKRMKSNLSVGELEKE